VIDFFIRLVPKEVAGSIPATEYFLKKTENEMKKVVENVEEKTTSRDTSSALKGRGTPRMNPGPSRRQNLLILVLLEDSKMRKLRTRRGSVEDATRTR
jgi:hypothetical protein